MISRSVRQSPSSAPDRHGLGWRAFGRRAFGRRLLVPPASVGTFLVVTALVAVACSAGSSQSPGSAATAPGGAGMGGTGASPAATGEMTVFAPGGTYTSVSPARLTAMLAAKDFVLVNVHVPYEGEIQGTDVFVPYDQVASQLGKLPAAKDAKILVYCRSGRMSTIAAKTLVGLGYANVWELDGGMIAWENAGYQLVQRPQS